MTIAGQNFEIYQGDKRLVIITVVDDDGAVQDLTGYDAVWVAFNQTPDDIVLTKTSTPASGITIPTPENEEIVIEFNKQDTEDLHAKNYGHQCEIMDSSGNHHTVTTGYMKVLKSIIHRFLH